MPRRKKITPEDIARSRIGEPDYPEYVCFECFEKKIDYSVVIVKRTGEVVEYCPCWKDLVGIVFQIHIN